MNYVTMACSLVPMIMIDYHSLLPIVSDDHKESL